MTVIQQNSSAIAYNNYYIESMKVNSSDAFLQYEVKEVGKHPQYKDK